MALRRYASEDDDSLRWQDFPFRDGDIVVSTRSKHGTTWTQMILLLLIHQQPELPAPLVHLSPWLDQLVEPIDTVVDRLQAQRHRRVIKTHTPLDGLPIDPRATYIVVGRHPLDAAVSLYHQGENIDRERLEQLTGQPVAARSDRPPPGDWLAEWIHKDASPDESLDSLPGVMWHLGDAWQRRAQPHVVLLHYSDLQADLAGQMRSLAERLGIHVAPDRLPMLVEAASFASMRSRAAHLAPDMVGVLRDKQAFFRGGTSGAGAALLDADQLAQYHARVAELAPPDLLAWLHR